MVKGRRWLTPQDLIEIREADREMSANDWNDRRRKTTEEQRESKQKYMKKWRAENQDKIRAYRKKSGRKPNL